jgi:hypothetical protein
VCRTEKRDFREAKSEAAKIQDYGKPAPACGQLGAQPDQELKAKKKNQGQHCDLAAAARKKTRKTPEAVTATETNLLPLQRETGSRAKP